MKLLRFLSIVGLIVALVLVVLLTYDSKNESAPPRCGGYRNDQTISISSTKLNAEVVKTSAELEKGLSGRPCIESNQAMLFDFGTPSTYAIWMKDMRFPIDIVWIDSYHKVVGVERDVSPSTYPDRFINKEQPAQYVLEMKANLTKSLNINLGTEIRF